MTYIEFFDKIASKNISACLTCVPDRVIYIGYNSKLMKKHISNYEKVFSNRGYNIEFLLKTVSKSNLDNGVELLSEIVETYDDCVFDVTGGEEMLTLALGIVYSKYPNKNIQIHKFNIKNNIIYDYDKDGTSIYKNAPQLSIDENIKIFGGAVAYGDIDDKKTTYKWDLTPDFLKDINLIWDISKDDVRYWNKQISVFEDAANNVVSSGMACPYYLAPYGVSLFDHTKLYFPLFRETADLVNIATSIINYYFFWNTYCATTIATNKFNNAYKGPYSSKLLYDNEPLST